jgi:hypothetical protein
MMIKSRCTVNALLMLPENCTAGVSTQQAVPAAVLSKPVAAPLAGAATAASPAAAAAAATTAAAAAPGPLLPAATAHGPLITTSPEESAEAQQALNLLNSYDFKIYVSCLLACSSSGSRIVERPRHSV